MMLNFVANIFMVFCTRMSELLFNFGGIFVRFWYQLYVILVKTTGKPSLFLCSGAIYVAGIHCSYKLDRLSYESIRAQGLFG